MKEQELNNRIKGKVILEAKADDLGNMIVYAPEVPVDIACKILMSMAIDLIFSHTNKDKSRIIKPVINFPHEVIGG